MARICIVTPGPLASNPRTVKEAQVLTQVGHRVHVIATRTLDHVDALDQDVLAAAAWTSERLDFRNPLQRALPRLRQACARAARAFLGMPQDHLYSFVTAALRARAVAWPADLYIAHYVAALPAVARAAARHRAIYAFDAEDFHLGDAPFGPAHRRERRSIHAVESRWLPGCAYVSAASGGIAKAYERVYRIQRPTVVLNVFPSAAGPSTPTPCGTATPGPSVYWVSQTIGPDRGLECAVQALALARTRPHLHLRGSPVPGFVEKLVALAQGAGVADRLHWLPPAPPSQMARLASAFDVGLAGETGATRNRRIMLSNKQFIYALAGLPTVFSDTPSHRDFLAGAPEVGVLYDAHRPLSLAASLDGLLGDPARLATARAAALQATRTRFNWEREAPSIVRLVNAALARMQGRLA